MRGTDSVPVEEASLLFDFEEVDTAASLPRHDTTSHAVCTRIRRLVCPQSHFTRQLKQDVSYFSANIKEADAGELDIVELACALMNIGHDVKVRSALGGGQNCFKNLYHDFLLVKGKEDCAGEDIVVECNFNAHFRITSTTAQYRLVLEALPNIFVGTVEQMTPVVDMVAREMARCFTDCDLPMPPWRGSSSIMSKWAPRRAEDRLPSCSASPVTPGRGNPRTQSMPVCSDVAPDAAGAGPGALMRSTLDSKPAKGINLNNVATLRLRQSQGSSPASAALVKIGFDYPKAPPLARRSPSLTAAQAT